MSSSRQPSNNFNNNNRNNPNQYSEYDVDDSQNLTRHPQQQQQQMPSELFDDREQLYENGLFHHAYSPQEDLDEDLPNEIVAELDARNRMYSHMNSVDDAVFSDDVQDAFKKYQNEFSKYWTHDDMIWENRFSDDELFDDDEQEELYAQMEECWNYMVHDDPPTEASKTSAEPSQAAQLNPDANEFQPSWFKASSNSTNQGSSLTLPRAQPKEERE